MSNIKLQVSLKKWFLFFSFIFIGSSVLLIYSNSAETFQFLLLIAFIGSLIVTAAVRGIFNFPQREVLLTDDRIIKLGLTEKQIPYITIEKIRVGSAGFTIYGNDSHVTISTMQSNFDLAKEKIKQITQMNKNIEIVGYKRFIKKYLPHG